MFTVLVELDVLVLKEQPSLSSPLIVSYPSYGLLSLIFIHANIFSLIDAKQARDLVTILSEAKQQIDPRLAEMARFGGGGGGGGGRGGGRGRGGGFTASNAAPLGSNRRW